jgi:hypothetical protein
MKKKGEDVKRQGNSTCTALVPIHYYFLQPEEKSNLC